MKRKKEKRRNIYYEKKINSIINYRDIGIGNDGHN